MSLLRWAVFFVFPVFMTSVIIVKSVVLFKRGAVKDKNVSMHSSTVPVPFCHRLLMYPMLGNPCSGWLSLHLCLQLCQLNAAFISSPGICYQYYCRCNSFVLHAVSHQAILLHGGEWHAFGLSKASRPINHALWHGSNASHRRRSFLLRYSEAAVGTGA